MPAIRFALPLARRSKRLELLLVTPVLLLLVGHLVVWGGYLWLGRQVQAAAEAGLQAARLAPQAVEQERLARMAAARILPGDARSLASRVVVQSQAEQLAVQVSYDASDWPIFWLRYVLPAPPSTVVKVARASDAS